MDVHVHRRRIELKEKDRDRVAALGQGVGVRLEHRIVQRAAVHRAAVHEHQHFVAGRPAGARRADETVQPAAALRDLHRQQAGCHLPAKDLRHALGEGQTHR